MPTKRGHIGLKGEDFVIQFSKPGHDVDTATADGLVFDAAAPRLRPLVSGSVLVAGRASTAAGSVNVNVALPKTFVGLPLLFVDCPISGDGVKGPGRNYTTSGATRRDFEVEYFIGRDYFTIQSWLLTAETFTYSVFDNEIT
jgi:hypothetical protein